MARHSIVEVKKLRPLDSQRLAQLLRLIQQIMELADVVDCEPVDGMLEVRATPVGSSGTMRVTYSMGTRYCCSCRPDDEAEGDCGTCMKSNRQWGVLRDSPTYRGSVNEWRFEAPRARIAVKKKSRVKK